MSKTVIIADDFTGAGDTGVTFALGGMRTAFLVRPDALPEALMEFDAVAVSSETRFMTADAAAQAVRDLTFRCREAGGVRFFKKVDSAMRGNPGAETAATLDALGYPAALVCPAMPGVGRVVRDGILYMNGQPLHTTSLGRDPFTPVHSGSVAEIMAKESALKTGCITLDDIASGRDRLAARVGELLADGCRALIADAALDSDLDVLAGLVRSSHAPGGPLPPLLPVGSSGLGRAFAGPARVAVPKPVGRILAVIGSLDENALAQAEFACRSGAFVRVAVDVAAALADAQAESERVLALVMAAGDANIVLQTKAFHDGGSLRSDEGERVAAALGTIAARLCCAAGFDAVYATGGSTATAVADALDIAFLVLEGELGPGVVFSTCISPATRVRQFVSKAGSFGGPQTLADVAAAFCKESVV